MGLAAAHWLHLTGLISPSQQTREYQNRGVNHRNDPADPGNTANYLTRTLADVSFTIATSPQHLRKQSVQLRLSPLPKHRSSLPARQHHYHP